MFNILLLRNGNTFGEKQMEEKKIIKKDLFVVEINGKDKGNSVTIYVWNPDKTKILKTFAVMQNLERKEVWITDQEVLIEGK